MAIRKPAKRTAATKARRSTKRTASIWDKVIELGARIPDAELGRLPRDGAQNVDHYVYGTPKQD